MNSTEKRNNVKKDYDIIANQYCEEFGVELEDKDLIEKFESNLNPNSKIIDLGGATGKVTKYFLDKGHNAICYDFSENMMINALRLFPNLPYILDDIINIKKHFTNNSVDGIIALYTLFHIPKENLEQLFIDINNVLKEAGIICFSFQLGNGEKLVDEPYLKEKGKNVLYINYLSKNELLALLNKCNFDVIYEIEKREEGENVLGENGNDAIYIISKKRR